MKINLFGGNGVNKFNQWQDEKIILKILNLLIFIIVKLFMFVDNRLSKRFDFWISLLDLYYAKLRNQIFFLIQ